jgi:lipopolysaccharide export system protein LptA
MLDMHLTLPRFTIERLRTLVLIGAAVLVVAIGLYLTIGQLKIRSIVKDIPGRLGIDIQQQANGVDYTQSRKGKTLFKIHAARAVQMKSGGKTLLHDVRIDLYGEDGTRADTISGSEFEYDPSAGIAHAPGVVEITLMRPGAKPAIAQLKPGGIKSAMPNVLNPPESIANNEIHVKTSGLLFDQKNGVATTSERVDFTLRQGNGNSIGAIYNSARGELILDHAVELHIDRGATQKNSDPVTVHAAHAEFHRDDQLCELTQAVADYSSGTAAASNARINFREDGSVLHMEGSGGVDLKTQAGGHVTAPRGTLDFDERSRPHAGVLEGGTQLAMTRPDRHIEGSSPTAKLLFDGQGQIRKAHLEQGVIFHSAQQSTTAKGTSREVLRSWQSQVADIDFAALPKGSAQGKKSNHDAQQNHGQNAVEARTIHGSGGVVITSETRTDGQNSPARLSADTVVAELAPGEVLTSLSGTGHASFEQRTAQGLHQASSSDQLDVQFDSVPTSGSGATAESEISALHQSGHVVLTQEPGTARAGQTAQAAAPQSAVRAIADRADYDGHTQILHLLGSPRVQDGALDMTAKQIDFARATGDAFAHGDVKASWSRTVSQSNSLPGAGLLGGTVNTSPGNQNANGPIHAVAAEAELHQSTQEVVFRGAPSRGQGGNQPRLWQAANSVSAPLITLNRQKQTLIAQASGAANPVRTVLVGSQPAKSRSATPSVIRVRSGDLRYSEGERIAQFHGGPLGSVTAETTEVAGVATVVSQEAEVMLLPAGGHSDARTSQSHAVSNSAVDQLIARGRVAIDWPDRKGTGDKLVYLGEDGSFTLTGTSTAPPRMTDPARGSVTGGALIFHSRDDSVTVEGDGAKTVTDTRSPK